MVSSSDCTRAVLTMACGTMLFINYSMQQISVCRSGRERVFIVGIRSDLGIEFNFHPATHTEDALLYDKWVSGTYWDRHHLSRRKRPSVPPHLKARVDRLSALMPEMLGLPWRTVRDAIYDLPKIAVGARSSKIANHYLNPGARSYFGHNGSSLDEPAKTLKAGDHGVPGGENTLRLEDDSVRLFFRARMRTASNVSR